MLRQCTMIVCDFCPQAPNVLTQTVSEAGGIQTIASRIKAAGWETIVLRTARGEPYDMRHKCVACIKFDERKERAAQ